jgi:hypothetical protein
MANPFEIEEEDSGPNGGWLERRRQRRKAHQAQVVREADKLFEQYGPAAQKIARGSSRQIVGFERRHFWRDVADELARRAEAQALERRLKSLNGPARI